MLVAATTGTGCFSAIVAARASTRLGVHEKHVYLASHERAETGDDVYVYCRTERTHEGGGFVPWTRRIRAYDAACVMYVCKPEAPAERCDESML